MVKVIPVGNKLLIKRDEASEKSGGGLWLPQGSQTPPAEGEILDVGPDVKNSSFIPGVKVIFAKHSGVQISVDEEVCAEGVKPRTIRVPYFLVSEENVIAIIERNGNVKCVDDELSVQALGSEEEDRVEKAIAGHNTVKLSYPEALLDINDENELPFPTCVLGA